MIINTVLYAGSARQNIDLSSSELFLVKNDGDTIELSFSYENSEGLSGFSVLYLNGSVIDSNPVTDGSTVTIDITSDLTSTGFYTLKLIVVDEEGSIDTLEFKVLFNYQNLGDMSFVYSSGTNSYILSAYSGTSASVLIPAVFNGTQGILPVTAIGNGVFFDNDTLESVEIPASVESIGATAFFSCSNLSSVTVLATTPPTLEADNVFDPYTELSPLKIYVPSASVSTYKAATNWSEYANEIYAIA